MAEFGDTEPAGVWMSIVVIGGVWAFWTVSPFVGCLFIVYFIYQAILTPEFNDAVIRNIDLIKKLIDPPLD